MKAFILLLLGTALLAIVLLGFAGVFPGGDGVVAYRTLPNGTEILVTQKYSPGDIGYEVGFYFRQPDSDWGWCYLDHEDTEWRNGRIEYDSGADVVTIWKGSTMRGRLHLVNNKWERPDVQGWSITAPQAKKEPPFTPANSGQKRGSQQPHR